MLGTAQPKPVRGTAKRQKAKRKRLESKQVKSVRAECVERDVYCLIRTRATHFDKFSLDQCRGPSEWAHFGKHRRCHTRGQAPTERHTTAGSGMLCQRHHRAYDAHEFDVVPQTDKGMDGPFMVTR